MLSIVCRTGGASLALKNAGAAPFSSTCALIAHICTPSYDGRSDAPTKRSKQRKLSSPCAPSHLASDVAGRDAAAAAAAAWSCLGECAAGAVAHLCKQLETIVEAHHRHTAMCVRGITRALLRVCALAHVLRMWDADAYRGRSAGGTPSICHPPRTAVSSARMVTAQLTVGKPRTALAHARARRTPPQAQSMARTKEGSGAALHVVLSVVAPVLSVDTQPATRDVTPFAR
jgi:hypothetical protein